MDQTPDRQTPGVSEELPLVAPDAATKRVFQATATILILFSVLVAIESLKLSYYTTLGPGSGFFPLWLAVLLGVLSAALLFQTATGRLRLPDEERAVSKGGAARVVLVLAAMVLVALLLQPVGFRITIAAFMLLMLVALGRQPLWLAASVSLALPLALFELFTQLLRVPLPRGLLGF